MFDVGSSGALHLTFHGLAVGRYEAPTNFTDKLFIKITLFVSQRRPTAEQAVVMPSAYCHFITFSQIIVAIVEPITPKIIATREDIIIANIGLRFTKSVSW